jgi:hypothetical protein
MRRCVILPLACASFLVIAGCSGSSDRPLRTPVIHDLADGKTIGKVIRGNDGTPEANAVISLVGVSCDAGKLIVRTNVSSIVGEMDCAKLPPQAAIERVLGQQVIISYNGGKVRIETVNGTAVEVEARSPKITENDVTPRP